ncbi:YgaP-like transmembrane domain [Pedobacter sp. ASV1-7]|uniref:YgaP-like transmembrane domain n=1 Tax=Pedobacter sp. ASV1-7 TaxID=3145237 RepID=UPI0032E8C09F
MIMHQNTLKLRSGKFSIEKQHYENIGLNERMVSMLLGGFLIGRGIKRPLRTSFLYGSYLAYRAFTGHCMFYELLGIDASRPHAINIRGEFIIDRPAKEVYTYWRNLSNLPVSVNHLLNVEMEGENLSRWKSNILGNVFPVDWHAEIVKDEPGRLIGWRSAPGTLIHHIGRVEFAERPDSEETLLKIVISYHPPAGGIGLGLAKLLNPYFESLLKKEIKTFKYKIETTMQPHQF